MCRASHKGAALPSDDTLRFLTDCPPWGWLRLRVWGEPWADLWHRATLSAVPEPVGEAVAVPVVVAVALRLRVAVAVGRHL